MFVDFQKVLKSIYRTILLIEKLFITIIPNFSFQASDPDTEDARDLTFKLNSVVGENSVGNQEYFF